MKRLHTAMAAVFAAAMTGLGGGAVVEAGSFGLPAGTWEVTWLEPRLVPQSKAFKTSFVRCYSAAEAARGSNPVMPAVQEAKCNTKLTSIGGDIVFDTGCGDQDHRLRISKCGAGYCGTYRYGARKPKVILESIVILRPTDGRCERS